MLKTAKPINKFMFFFIIHDIVINIMVFAVLAATGREYDLYTLQTFGTLLVFLPPLVIYFIITRAKIKDVFYLTPLGVVNFFLVIAVTLSVQPLFLFLSSLSAIIFPNNTQEFVSSLFSVPLGAVIITTSVLPAVFEESIFRGVIFHKNLNIPVSWKVLLSAFFFALMHLDPQQFLYTFAAGVIFAYIMYITRSIFATILAHFTLNATQTVLLYSSLQAGDITAAAAETPASVSLIYSLILLAFSLPFLIFSIYLLLMNNKDKIIMDRLVIALQRLSKIQGKNGEINKETGKMSGLDINKPSGYDKNKEAAIKAAETRTESKSVSGKKNNTRFNKIFTWEFWVVIVIYIIYIVFIYI